MAISVTQRPQKICMKRSNSTFVATSTNSAQTGFKFIVVVKDGSGTQISKYYIPKNPSDRLLFDLAPVIDQEVKIDLDDANNDALVFTMPNSLNSILSGATNGIQKYTIEFGELYEVAGVLTEFLALTSETIRFLDGATQYRLGINYQYTDLEPDGSTKKTWMTDRVPSSDNIIDADAIEVKASESDYGTICFLNDSTGLISSGAVQIKYTIYNASGVQGTDSITIGSTYGIGSPSSVLTSEKLAYMGFLPKNLNEANNPFLYPPSSVSDWTYYKFTLLDGTINEQSRDLIVVRDDQPCKHEVASLHWQNQVGGWEYFRFDGKVDEDITKEGKTYTKPIGEYGGTTFDYETYSRQTTNFYLNNKIKFTLRTGGMNADEQRLLENILKSQEVVMYYGGEWLPVIVDTSSYKVQQKASKLRFAQMVVELAQDQL